MKANPEFAWFARLVESLRPWLDQVVVIGGWAHRLYRLHPFAQQLQYEPLATLDADIALPARFKVTGDEISGSPQTDLKPNSLDITSPRLPFPHFPNLLAKWP